MVRANLQLRVIEGGAAPRVAFDSAPDVLPIVAADRAAPGSRRPSVSRFALALALAGALHAGAIAAAFRIAPPDEARSEGGSSDEIVMDGVSVVLLDSMPSDGSEGLPEATAVQTASAAVAAVDDATPEAAAVDDAIAASPEATTAPEVAMVNPAPVAADTTSAIVADTPTTLDDATASPSPTDVTATPVSEAPAIAVADAAAPTAIPDSVAMDAPFEAAQPTAQDIATAQPVDQVATVATASMATSALPDAPSPAAPADDAATTADTVTPASAANDAAPAPVADDVARPNPAEAPVAVAAAEPAKAVEPAPDDPAARIDSSATHVAAVDLEEPADAPAPARKPPPKPAPKPAPKRAPKPAPAKAKSAPAAPASQAETAAQGPWPGNAGARGVSRDERGSANVSSYQARLAAHLRRFRAYPAAAADQGLRGTATVTFTVNGSGAVMSARLAGGSGHAILDEAAVAMVKRASPFPPIPPALAQSTMTVTVPVRFDRR
jgi:protein TonB